MDRYFHVKSREDYNALMVELEAKGLRWSMRRYPTKFDAWTRYGINTVIHVRDHLTFCNYRYYKARGVTIETYEAKPAYRKFGFDVLRYEDVEVYSKDKVDYLTVETKDMAIRFEVNNFVSGVTDVLIGKVIRDHYGEPEIPTSIKILQYVNENSYPSVREIAEGVGLRSSNSVHGHLLRLRDRGFIKFDSQKPRTWEVTPEGRKEIDSYVSTPYATT